MQEEEYGRNCRQSLSLSSSSSSSSSSTDYNADVRYKKTEQ